MKHPVKNEVPIEFQDCPLAVTRQKDESSPANCEEKKEEQKEYIIRLIKVIFLSMYVL